MGKLSCNETRNNGRKLGIGKAAAAIAAGIAVLLLTGCSVFPAEEQALKPPLIKPAQEKFDIAEAKKGTIQTFLKGTANFVATKTVSLYFKESGGRLKQIHVKQGQTVRQGDLLLELETGDLVLQTKLQKLNVERARINYEQAKRGGVSDSELRLREIDLEKEVISQQAMEKRVADSRLTAPIDGIITYIGEMNTGDSITAFAPLLGIDDPRELQLRFQASATKDLIPVQPKMNVTVNYKDKDYTGKVLQTPASSPVTTDKNVSDRNALTLILGIDNLPAGIQVGENADFVIPLQKREDVVVLPRAGVRSYLGRDYVQIAEGERRKEVDVEIGLKTSTEVEIVRGLDVGQQVILNN
jgi:RND family efflux transporter MFP subunit